MLSLAVVGCTDESSTVQEAGERDAASDAGPADAGAPVTFLSFERVPLELDAMTEGGHQRVTTFRFIPGTNQLLLAELHGDIYHYEVGEEGASLLGHFSVSDHVYPDEGYAGDCGLISMAFDPDFDANRLLYLGACMDEHGSGVLRVTFNPSDYDGIASTAVVVIREELPDSPPIHNVGHMGFDGDGYLWVLFGERNSRDMSQYLTNNLGALLRIVPSREPGEGGYAPAPDNPFAGDPERSPDIYAYGLRSPWTGHYDSLGRWWIGDVGSAGSYAAEEVNIVTDPGSNFGWPIVEGPCTGDCERFVDPVRSWTHASAHPFVLELQDPFPSNNRVAWVGVEYRDRGTDPYGGLLAGRMLYGDMCVGFVRLIEVDATGEILFDAQVGALPKVSAWDQASDGYLYVTTFGSCEAQLQRLDAPAGLWRAVPGEE
jgi:glucose/arabinose dehydrogenase